MLSKMNQAFMAAKEKANKTYENLCKVSQMDEMKSNPSVSEPRTAELVQFIKLYDGNCLDWINITEALSV